MAPDRHGWAWAASAVAAAGALLIAGRAEWPNLFQPNDRAATATVEDRAELLGSAESTRIAEYHAAMLGGHDIDYRVLAIASGADLERTAHEYFAEAGVGSLSETGRGLLLVIDSASERVRLEVSTSLEGVYTDAFVAFVQTRQMAPFFAANRVADGILATTELIVGRAQEAEAAGHEFAPQMPARSMGGGASTTAAIGTDGDPSEAFKQRAEPVATAGLEPLGIVETYLDRMTKRDARADLSLYSRDTVAMLRSWVVTPAQMDNVAKTYRGCTVDGVRILGATAVVRYRVDQRQCAPYFLRREDDAWKLDLSALSSAVRFNHENQFRFQTPLPPEYAPAFEDWRLDRNGFPHAP